MGGAFVSSLCNFNAPNATPGKHIRQRATWLHIAASLLSQLCSCPTCKPRALKGPERCAKTRRRTTRLEIPAAFAARAAGLAGCGQNHVGSCFHSPDPALLLQLEALRVIIQLIPSRETPPTDGCQVLDFPITTKAPPLCTFETLTRSNGLKQ